VSLLHIPDSAQKKAMSRAWGKFFGMKFAIGGKLSERALAECLFPIPRISLCIPPPPPPQCPFLQPQGLLMLKLRTLVPALFLAFSASAFAEDVKVTLTGAHICCGKCEKAIKEAVEGAGAKATVSRKETVVTAADAATAQKAVDALVEAGFWAVSDNAGVAPKDDSGVAAGAVKRLELTDVHDCCCKCEKAIVAAAKSVEGVKEAVVKDGDLVVEGDFDGAKVVAALHAAGLHGKLKK
jgi:hypothetical protein